MQAEILSRRRKNHVVDHGRQCLCVDVAVGSDLVVRLPKLRSQLVLRQSLLSAEVARGELELIQLDNRATRGASRAKAAAAASEEEDEDDADRRDEDEREPSLAFSERIEQFRPR